MRWWLICKKGPDGGLCAGQIVLPPSPHGHPQRHHFLRVAPVSLSLYFCLAPSYINTLITLFSRAPPFLSHKFFLWPQGFPEGGMRAEQFDRCIILKKIHTYHFLSKNIVFVGQLSCRTLYLNFFSINKLSYCSTVGPMSRLQIFGLIHAICRTITLADYWALGQVSRTRQSSLPKFNWK